MPGLLTVHDFGMLFVVLKMLCLIICSLFYRRIHGRLQKFFQGGREHWHFAYPFSGYERCSVNRPSQNALPFLHHKENSPSFQSFCWIGVSSNIIIIVNCRQLNLNWTWTIYNCVCGAYI